MDTTDQEIHFDEAGECEYCQNFRDAIQPNWDTTAAGLAALTPQIDKIKAEGAGKPFDCIIGLSGGLDSSYVTYVAKEILGLRPLLLHVDAGWNTDQAVSNIEKLVDGLSLDLYTEVVDWEAVKDMQVAFLRSGIPDQDLVQDAAFFSCLYRFARKYKVNYVITGSNFSTECCREPEAWGGYLGIDRMLFKDIHSRFGTGDFNRFPLVDILRYKFWYQKIRGMKVLAPLNHVPYIKADAESYLEARFGWKRFQHKHHESRFTRFYEDYWLPQKFGFAKRRAHFSSLILTGQMSREAAIDRLSRPEMDEHFLSQEFNYVASKLGMGNDELQRIFEAPNKTYHAYKNKRWLISLGARLMTMFGGEKRRFR